ncbi:MAG: nucleotidyl transferase AbiEii/AbiGii toxin family protein [Deltaproteobacteria bacterium]|nr:nucleotidyl transferase AbiEii/AbiGii toxin family protein [Deltaproteobacteria bacterium]
MERLEKIVEELRLRTRPPTEQELLNTVREYLQVLILKFVFQSRFGAAVSFMGGTALRICHGTKRYSEDLDFSLDDKKVPWRFSTLMDLIHKELRLTGFDVDSTVSEDKIVQKGFFRFAGLGGALGLRGFEKDQKLHIKIEVDVRPPLLKKDERESFFVNSFQEIFPILKHTLPTLFAGKVLAILHRPYARGRDYYDLIWYLSRKTELNLAYLNRSGKGKKFKDRGTAMKAVAECTAKAKPAVILKDVGRFLEDPAEAQWLSRFDEVFRQLVGTGETRNVD